MSSGFVASVHGLSNLKPLFKGSNFLARFSLKSIPHPDVRIYNDPLHPMYKRCHESAEKRAQELLIYTKTTKAACTKYATVRRRCRRLVVEATRQALRERGYHLDGRPIDTAPEKPQLTGTIIYIPVTEIVRDSWSTILAEVTQAVEKFIIHKAHNMEKRSSRAGTYSQVGGPRPWTGPRQGQKEQHDQGRRRANGQ